MVYQMFQADIIRHLVHLILRKNFALSYFFCPLALCVLVVSWYVMTISMVYWASSRFCFPFFLFDRQYSVDNILIMQMNSVFEPFCQLLWGFFLKWLLKVFNKLIQS